MLPLTGTALHKSHAHLVPSWSLPLGEPSLTAIGARQTWSQIVTFQSCSFCTYKLKQITPTARADDGRINCDLGWVLLTLVACLVLAPSPLGVLIHPGPCLWDPNHAGPEDRPLSFGCGVHSGPQPISTFAHIAAPPPPTNGCFRGAFPLEGFFF